jgi:hypothetical protein
MSVGTQSGVPTSPQVSRRDYEHLIGTIRAIVDRVMPSNATVLVVSRGDERLLDLGPRRTLHFPQAEDGRYAGYHPADSDEAIALLENMRSRGAEFLLLPSVAFWWLDYYDAFRQYLDHRYPVVERGEHCLIVDLAESPQRSAAPDSIARPSTSWAAEQMGELLESLLPQDARTAILSTADQDLAELEAYERWPVAPTSREDRLGVSGFVNELEDKGVRFVVVPKALFGWLQDEPDPVDRPRERLRLVTRQAHLCEVYELRPTLEPVVGAHAS